MSENPEKRLIIPVIKKILYNLILFIFTIVLALIFPILLLILFLPIWITRQTVKLLAKLIRRDLCEMVTCAANTVANANGSEDNPRMVILVELYFEEDLSFEQVIVEFSARAIDKNKNGKLQHPKLQQYVTSWFGYRFWNKDKMFDIKNHTILYSPNKEVTLDDLRTIEEQLLSKPFAKNRSPWEILVIKNTIRNTISNESNGVDSNSTPKITTTIIFRCSHILADGYSVKKLLEGVCISEMSPKLKINFPSKTIMQKLSFPFKFYHTMAEVQVLSLMKFPFKIKDDEKLYKNTFETSDVISTKVIQIIKKRLGVSFTSVVIGIVAGVLRKLGELQRIPLTETIPCAIPLPKPGHPDTLCNHFTLAVMHLPISESDAARRVKKCYVELMKLKGSAYPAAAASFMTVFGSCFNGLGDKIGMNTFSAVSISYLPSGLERISFLGVEAVGQTFFMGVQKGCIGASITVSSYKDRVIFHATVDANVVSKDVMRKYFKQIVNEEVEKLRCFDFCEV